MREVYVVGACRTAIGSFGGSLKEVPAARLGAVAVREALSRAGVEPGWVDEVTLGCVLAAGWGQNVARQAAVEAGIPVEVPAQTLNMVCGSGMRSVVDGARAILAGDAEIVVAGGAESMSGARYVLPAARWGARMGEVGLVDSMVEDGLTDAFHRYHMGVTAETICGRWKLTREELDRFALASQQKAAAALEVDRFAQEIVPVPVRRGKNTVEFVRDEHPRGDVTLESLGRLRPAFQQDGMVTAGNASGLNDGAAALVLASGAAVRERGLKPLARLAGWGQAGVDPAIMGIGPVEATRRALKQAGLDIWDIQLVEANEAFAAQSIAVARELELDMETVNVNGGAIALGHPIGASGARIIVTLLHELGRRPGARLGLATLCVGGGMGVSTVFERC